MADKYSVRDYINKEFGEDLLIPLAFVTSNYKDISLSNIPDYPCIVKATHDSGSYLIIKDKSKIDFNKLFIAKLSMRVILQVHAFQGLHILNQCIYFHK
jgi:hypothetical protein